MTSDRARVMVMRGDPGRQARGHEPMQGPHMTTNEPESPSASPPTRRGAPLVLSDVYLLTAESGGNVAVPGLTVVLDGSGLTVRKPDGDVGAVVAWADVSGLVANKRIAHAGRKPRRHRRGGDTVSDASLRRPQRQSRRARVRGDPAGRRGRFAGPPKTTSGLRSRSASVHDGTHRRARWRIIALGVLHCDRDREVLIAQGHLTKRGKPATWRCDRHTIAIQLRVDRRAFGR